MVNEIPTLLANHQKRKGDLWYIDDEFFGVKIPSQLSSIYSAIIGDNPDTTVMQLMSILNCVDIQPYKSVFDSRELFDNVSGSSIYDLYKNHVDENTIIEILSIPGLTVLFSGDDYIKTLGELYFSGRESIIRVCAVILALAYKLKQQYISIGGK